MSILSTTDGKVSCIGITTMMEYFLDNTLMPCIMKIYDGSSRRKNLITTISRRVGPPFVIF
jgi:hypothetical protein